MNRTLLILATTAAKLTAAAPVLMVGYGVRLPDGLQGLVIGIEALSVIAMLGLASWALHSQLSAYRQTHDPWLRLTAPATGLATAAVLIVPPLAGEAGAGWERAVTLIGLAVLVLAVLVGDVAGRHAAQDAQGGAIDPVERSAPVEPAQHTPNTLVQVNFGSTSDQLRVSAGSAQVQLPQPQPAEAVARRLPEAVQAVPGLAEALADPALRDGDIAARLGISRQRVTHLRREAGHVQS